MHCLKTVAAEAMIGVRREPSMASYLNKLDSEGRKTAAEIQTKGRHRLQGCVARRGRVGASRRKMDESPTYNSQISD